MPKFNSNNGFNKSTTGLNTSSGFNILSSESSGGGGGGSAPSAVLDAPIDAAMVAKSLLVFGVDRLQAGGVSTTARMLRVSDSAQQDFGYDTSTGIFNYSAVATWAGGSDVKLVKLYDQNGTGKELTAVNDIYVIQSGVVKRFGTDWNTSDATLSFSSTNGGLGCFPASNGYYELTNSGLNLTNGIEVHCLYAPLNRKKVTSSTEPTGLNGTTNTECIFSYYTGSTNYFQYLNSNGTATHYGERNGSVSGGSSQTVTAGQPIKACSTNITTHRCDSTNISFYNNGRRAANATPNAGNITANGSLTNGTFRIGRGINTATNYGSFLFGGVIITQTLTELERFKVHTRLEQVAFQHRIMTKTQLADLIGTDAVILDWGRDSNPSTGALNDRNSHLSISWNSTTVGGNSPNLDFAYTLPTWGLQGVRSIGTGNYANAFIANNSWLSDKQKFSAINIGYRDMGGDLAFWWGDGDPSGWPKSTAGTNTNYSVGQGFHHSQPGFYRRVAATYDAANITANTDWGDDGPGKLSQAIGKYHLITPNGAIDNRETVDITGITQANPAVVTCPGHGRSNSAKTITAISKANPAVVTSSNHGFVTGNKVWITGVSGMTQVNNAQYTITKVDANNYSLNGVDSTSYSTYTSGGTASKARVYISGVSGMTQANNADYSITVIDANSFSLNGIDSSAWSAYTSGGTIKYTTDAPWTVNSVLYPTGTAVDWSLVNTWANTTLTTPEDANNHNWTSGYPFDSSYLEIQISTCDPGTQYNPVSPNTAYMRTGTVWNYAAPLMGSGFGHLDGGIAREVGNASIRHATSTNKIQTQPYLSMIDGTRIMTIIIPDVVLTLAQAEQIKVNLYKVLLDGWSDVPVAPTNTVAPAISGTEQVGQTLTCSTGTWAGNPTPTYTYQWQYDTAGNGTFTNCTGTGNTTNSYLLTTGEQGNKVRCVVTATNTAGTASANSNQTGLISAASSPPSNTVAPAITGTEQVTQTLTCSSGTWTGSPTSYAYQWQHDTAGNGTFTNCAGTGNATNSYQLTVTEQGNKVRCVVTATNGAGSTSANSNQTGLIAAAPSYGTPTTDVQFRENSGTTAADAKGVVSFNIDNNGGASPPTWDPSPDIVTGYGQYVSLAGTVSTGYKDASANANHYTSQPWTRIVWFKLNALPSVTSDFMALGTNASSSIANQAYYCTMNNGATVITFNTATSAGAADTLHQPTTPTMTALGTSAKVMVALRYDPTGGAGATIKKLDVYKEGVGNVSTVSDTTGNPHKQNSAYLMSDRRIATGTGINAKWYRDTVWANQYLTDQQILDIFNAGSESTAY